VKKLIVLMMLALTLAVAGCGTGKDAQAAGGQVSDAQAVSSEGTANIFTDALGRQVEVKSHERVASLLGSFSDIWLLSGGSLVAAVDDSWDSLELDLPEDTVKLGSILSPNTELLLASNPDLVLASSNTEADVQMQSLLESAGITVIYFDVQSFDDYLGALKTCTDITGRADLYQKYGLDVKAEIEQVKQRIDGSSPKVLFLRAASSNVKAKGSEGTVGGEILADLGCINIADSDSSLLDDLSLEAIVKADPDYIFVTTQGSNTQAALDNVDKLLRDNPVWSSLTAVQNGRYHVLDKKLYNLKPNAKWGQAYRELADILYP
jgi:iron complex transport system substrate-binding protein